MRIESRIDKLTARAQALLDDQAFVTVVFSDGSRRTMRLCDVIDILQEQPRVVDVLGEARHDDGHLLALVQELARG